MTVGIVGLFIVMGKPVAVVPVIQMSWTTVLVTDVHRLLLQTLNRKLHWAKPSLPTYGVEQYSIILSFRLLCSTSGQ